MKRHIRFIYPRQHSVRPLLQRLRTRARAPKWNRGVFRFWFWSDEHMPELKGDTGSARRGSNSVLREVALLFLRLGTISFGGPAAHIAMMEDEVVKRRKWITHEYFLDLLGATNIIPGPNSTEMGIHIGYVRAGWKGLVIAGVCFILPAVTICILFAHLYVLYGSFPQINSF